MGWNLPKTVSSGTGNISTENLSETKHPLGITDIPSIEKQLRVERGTRTGTQSEGRSISFRGKERQHRIHG